MKVLIAGSRSIKNFELKDYISKKTDLIISGGAIGIDSIAEKYADDNSISKLVLRPKYAAYGKAAPLIRNKEMVDISDEVLIVWDGVSKGSNFTINYARHRKKTTVIILDNESNTVLSIETSLP